MTAIQRRKAAYASTVMRFLLDEFIEGVGGDAVTDMSVEEIRKDQTRAARILLPGPAKGAFTLQQLTLRTLTPNEFQELRREVRDWLKALVMLPGIGHGRLVTVTLTPGRTLGRFRAALAEGAPLDVFWYYLTNFIDQVGVSQIGVCHAPKSKRDPGQQNPELCGETEDCERLYLRRGHAKEYCSERCRARVATQNARERAREREKAKAIRLDKTGGR